MVPIRLPDDLQFSTIAVISFKKLHLASVDLDDLHEVDARTDSIQKENLLQDEHDRRIKRLLWNDGDNFLLDFK